MVELGQITAVIGVLAVFGLTLWFLRTRGMVAITPLKGKQSRRLECIERLPLGPHHALHLVRLGDRSLLVASSPGGCSLVQALPAEAMQENAR